MRCATLDANFLAPVVREYVLAHGLRSAGRRSLRNLLGSGPGSAVLLVPGGAAGEAGECGLPSVCGSRFGSAVLLVPGGATGEVGDCGCQVWGGAGFGSTVLLVPGGVPPSLLLSDLIVALPFTE